MLTTSQIEAFRLAAAQNEHGSDDPDDCCEPEQVVETRETIADFIAAHGQPARTYGDLSVWDGVQQRMGAPRGCLFVMDCGDARAAYFTR